MKSLAVFSIIILFLTYGTPVYAWSNGGWSTSPSHPAMGTHDWIAEKAILLLPVSETAIFKNNINWLYYGTELPDRPKNMGGYGDQFNHHVYFNEKHQVTDDSSARRANETYNEALALLKKGNFSGGVMVAGAVSHYISDMAVWGHVMGANTPWGVEKHHEDYETYVNDHQSMFDQSIMVMGPLNHTTAYQATLELAYNTMFVPPNATWMDTHYNWSDPQFKTRVGVSLNLAANAVATVFHTLWLDAGQPIPELPQVMPVLIVVVLAVSVLRKREHPLTG